MRKKRCLVVGVTAPTVAHSEQQWQVTVIYGVHLGTYLKKVKKTIFTTYRPELNTWIEVSFL